MAKIGSLKWQVERFICGKIGVPNTISQLEPDLQNVLITSLPKAGTNLVERAVVATGKYTRVVRPTLLDDNYNECKIAKIVQRVPSGKFITAHIPHSKELGILVDSGRIKVILMVRDPRDVVMSNAYYLAQDKGHRFHKIFRDISDLNERVSLLIHGDKSINLNPIEWTFGRYHSWFGHCHNIIKFEDLIGERGGGDKGKQLTICSEIASTLGYKSSQQNEVAKWMVGDVFSSESPTFRSGKIGSWQTSMSKTNRRLIEEKLSWFFDSFNYGY